MGDIHYTDTEGASPNGNTNLPSNTTPGHGVAVLLVDNQDSLAYSSRCLPKGWTCLKCDAANIDAQSYLGFSKAVICHTKDDGGRAWAQAIARIITIPTATIEYPERLAEPWDISHCKTPAVVTRYILEAAEKCKTRIAPEVTPPAPINGKHALAAAAQSVIHYESPQLICGGIDGRGRPKPILANVITLLKGATQFFNLRWDDFSQFAYLGDARVEDGDILTITNWVQHNHVHASTGTVKEGVEAVARECRFNQVREYLEGLRWDGLDRLPSLFIDNGQAEDTPINRAFPVRWFISAVARALKPGCQADCMLILQGAQGLRKSSFFRAIGEPWFTSHLSDLSTRDSRQELRGIWVVEIAELNGFKRTDFNTIKAFLTETTDHYRDPYGLFAKHHPRTCVFGGTRNPDGTGWLPDETGGRRFWIIDIHESIDVKAILRDRDQLWAEAVARYRRGEQWHLTDEEEDAARVIQEEAFEPDLWEEIIADHLRGVDMTTAPLVLRDAIGLSKKDEMDKARQMKVGRILKRLGFTKAKIRVPLTATGKATKQIRGYVRDSMNPDDYNKKAYILSEELGIIRV